MDTKRLAGRTALVTGSTEGIGAGVALAFAAEGAHVVVTGRNAQRGADLVERIGADGGRADFVRADLAGGMMTVQRLADEGARRLAIANKASVSRRVPGIAGSLS